MYVRTLTISRFKGVVYYILEAAQVVDEEVRALSAAHEQRTGRVATGRSERAARELAARGVAAAAGTCDERARAERVERELPASSRATFRTRERQHLRLGAHLSLVFTRATVGAESTDTNRS